MDAASDKALLTSASRRWGAYVLKALVALGLVFFVSRADTLPPLVVVIIWAVLSAALAIGGAYHGVTRKLYRQVLFQRQGKAMRINSGRILTLVLCFCVAATMVAGLLLEAPSWGRGEWGLVALSIPVFVLVYLVVERLVRGEYRRDFQMSRSALFSALITGLLLCIAFAVFHSFHAPTFTNAAEAFSQAHYPFANSSSALLRQTGEIVGIVDAFTLYAVSLTNEASRTVFIVLQCILHASALFGVATILGVCVLEWRELKKVFLPLQPLEGFAADEAHVDTASSKQEPSQRRLGASPIKGYVAMACVLPILLTAGFFLLDQRAEALAQTSEYTSFERFVRGQVSIGVYAIDGKYYDKEKVDALIDEAGTDSQVLYDKASQELVDLINTSFDERLANVDSYLDWYYSLPADYERLAGLVTGGVEEFVQDEFTKRIEEGIDDTALKDKLEEFAAQSSELKSALESQLASYEIPAEQMDNIPRWLTEVEKGDLRSMELRTLEPTQKLIDAPVRMGISAAAGVGAGFIAKRLVQKLVGRTFFKNVVSHIFSTLTSRGVGAAAGGAVGLGGGPAGVAAGVAVGTGVAVGIDFAWLKVDEKLNRETYRQEIVELIEEQRAEMLVPFETQE